MAFDPTLTLTPPDKENEKQTNDLSLVSADSLSVKSPDRDVDQQVAAITPTTTGQIETDTTDQPPAQFAAQERQQEQEEEDKFDPATARFAPYTASDEEIDDYIMSYAQAIYKLGGQYLADEANYLINTPLIDHYVRDRDGNLITESAVKNQKNPYYGKPQALNNAYRRSYMQKRGGDFPLRPGSDKTVEAGQYIATKPYDSSSWGEVYWNPDKKRFQYHRTYLEQTGKDVADIGKAIGTALVEFPMTVYGLAYLAHMGLSHGAHHGMSGGEWISGLIAGATGGGEQAGRDLFKRTIGDKDVTLEQLLEEGASEYEDVREAYEEFVEPARAIVGKFGPSEDKDMIDRFLEEVFVMGPLALTGAGVVVGMGKKAGMKMARNYGKLALLKERTGMPSVAAMQHAQKRILHDLAAITVPAGRHGDAGRLADASIQRVIKMSPAERRKEFRKHGIPERDIELYEAAQEAISLEILTGSKQAKRIWKNWTKEGTPHGWPKPRPLKAEDITGQRMAAKFFMSEIMMAAGFSGAEELYPDDLFLQMGAGAMGAFWGGFGPTWLVSQGLVGAVRKKARVAEGNWRTWMYMMSKGFASSPIRPGSREFWEGIAAEQAIRYFGDWEKFKYKSTEDKITEANTLVANSKEFDSMTQQALRGVEWAKGTPKETLAEMERVFRGRMEAMARLDEVLSLRGQGNLNRIMQDMIDIPALDYLEKMLLGNVNTSMKFGVSSIPMLSELSYIVQLRNDNIERVQSLIREMGALPAEKKKSINKDFFKIIRDYRDSMMHELNVSKVRYETVLDKHPVTTMKQLQNTDKLRVSALRADLDARLGVSSMADNPQVKHTYWIDQNRRLDDIFTYNMEKINEAYDAVDFDYVLQGTDEIASTLENIVAISRDLPEYTRTFVGGQPRPISVENLLHSARQRFLFDDMAKLNFRERLQYVRNLHGEISTRIPVQDEIAEAFWRDPNNEILSSTATIHFNNTIENLLEEGDIAAANNKVQQRVIALSKISASTGAPYMGARFSIKEFSRMRTHITGKLVTSIGVTKDEYRKVLKELDTLVGRGEQLLKSSVGKDPSDADQLVLKNYYFAKDLYRDYMNLWDVGIARKLLGKDEQGQRNFGVIHLDDYGNVVSRKNATHEVVSEKNFMHNFLLPLWSNKPDEMAQAAKSFRNMFKNEDGRIDPLDVNLLLNAFAYEVYRKRLGKAKPDSVKEQQAYENFREHFDDILDEAQGTLDDTNLGNPVVVSRVSLFRAAEDSYRKLGKNDIVDTDVENTRLQLIRDENAAMNLTKKVVDLFLDARKTAVEGSIFHRLAQVQAKTRKDIVTEIFGGERGGAIETQYMGTAGVLPVPIKGIEEFTGQLPPGAFGIDLMEAQGRLGTSTPAKDFKQILDAFRGTEDFETVKEFLTSILVDDLIETVWQGSNQKLDFNASGIVRVSGRKDYADLLKPARAKVYEFEKYIKDPDNRELFTILLGEGNVQILDDIFVTTVATEAERLGTPMTGLLQSYTASGLQSVFWAVARKVISIRFAAGMLGVQAYRIGTTKFFMELMKNPKGALILNRSLKQKTPLTRDQLSAFKEVMTTMFGPHVSSRISEDWAEDQRKKFQGNPQRIETAVEQARASRKDVAGLDKLRAFQGLQDKQDPIWGMVDTSKFIEYEELSNRPTVEEQMSRLGSYDRFPRTS